MIQEEGDAEADNSTNAWPQHSCPQLMNGGSLKSKNRDRGFYHKLEKTPANHVQILGD
jgi:hypothetical protein